MSSKKVNPTVIDLFCGAGGLSSDPWKLMLWVLLIEILDSDLEIPGAEAGRDPGTQDVFSVHPPNVGRRKEDRVPVGEFDELPFNRSRQFVPCWKFADRSQADWSLLGF